MSIMPMRFRHLFGYSIGPPGVVVALSGRNQVKFQHVIPHLNTKLKKNMLFQKCVLNIS